MADSSNASIHVALLPSSGMGHLAPFLRLAASLDSHGYTVTLISIPTISSAESSHLSHFFKTYPRILRLEFHLLPLDTSDTSIDPFFLQWEKIHRSAHLLPPLLTSTSSSISALIIDTTLTAPILDVVADLPFSNYVLFTGSAAMLAFITYFPIAIQHDTFHESYQLHIPGLPPIANSDIPPLLQHPSNIFRTTLIKNGLAHLRADGVIVNTLEKLEPDALAVLNNGVVVPAFPPVVAVGPLKACNFESGGDESNQELVFSWLNAQPERSVVYVSFGSRTVLSEDQIKQLAEGLKRSECRFLWVVKSKIVDREDQVELRELVGDEFLETVMERGLVVKDWVEQWKVLGHPAVGGFVSHCGWNSVAEAAWHGVPVLAWPQAGDQRINARVVESSGLGIWERKWGWGGGNAEVVMDTEIAEKVLELMNNACIRASAALVGEEARRAVSAGGTSYNALMKMMESLKSRVM